MVFGSVRVVKHSLCSEEELFRTYGNGVLMREAVGVSFHVGIVESCSVYVCRDLGEISFVLLCGGNGASSRCRIQYRNS